MAIAHIVSSAVAQADDNPTTAAVDTTGANFCLGLSVDHSSGGGGTATDNKSNSYTGLTVPSLSTNARARIAYKASATVGSGHTFTFSGTFVLASMFGAAFSGVHATPFDVENGSSVGSGTTIQAGSVTPSVDGCLVVALLGFDVASGGISINSGFSTPITGEPGFGTAGRGGSWAYLIQTTAAAVNPTWTSANNTGKTAVIAVFKPATGSVELSPGVGAVTLTGTSNRLGFGLLMPDEL